MILCFIAGLFIAVMQSIHHHGREIKEHLRNVLGFNVVLIIYFISQFVVSCLCCNEIDLLHKALSAVSVAVDCLSRLCYVYHLCCLLRQQPQETDNVVATDQLVVTPVIERDTTGIVSSHVVERNTDIGDGDVKLTASPAIKGNI